ncbi:hypothetical protein M501DRAFT_418858 [Patellaria atrata CBS 101060]|uniref:TATA element modulatory factor 1 TATA binding domain-containing protein n=1 Tax=Patellaria atrata CBS 101060 TaxID=1346257 RepID=A0A9P4SGF2_9PEZI|nr:hypothetical protein M501DRAFT_418858 [Patellaria atrata CBS 101060]
MRQQEHAKVMEIELRGEITSLETKLELLRSRTEESTAGTDTQTKLLRQIETLQTQYALASENWHGIESTLTSRVAALEKERDETVKRESDVRRKARDVNSKSRRLEEELEAVHDRARSLEHDMQEQAAAMTKLQSRLSGAETALNDAKETFEQEKKVWEAEMTQRVEDEKLKWRLESSNINNSQHQGLGLVDSGQYLQSPTTTGASLSQPHRRHHSPSPAFGEQNTYRRPIPRTFSSEVGALSPPPIPDTRSHSQSRRSSRQPHPGTPPLRQDSLPSLSTHLNGAPSHLGSVSQTPSIHAFDPDDAFDSTSSPHRTIADMLSTSASGAGPSVQLVERMSAAVRRLESEKAVVKEEMARLAAQRDGAREEVVALLREVEEKRGLEERVAGMRRELEEVGVRYATTLEMLGEKSEEVEELRADVVDLKRIYRELVESTVK